jgi:hypothetical protein
MQKTRPIPIVLRCQSLEDSGGDVETEHRGDKDECENDDDVRVAV